MTDRTAALTRETAIERGLDFIYRFGNKRKCFADYGSFLICCFALVAATSREPRLRRLGRARAKELLQRWSRLHPYLPADASPDVLLDFVLVRYAECRIHVRRSVSAKAITAVVRRFSASDLLGFDPGTESPPDDLPYRCDCTFQNPRGRRACKQCKRRLRIRSRYRVWMEALANTYVAERSGVFFGAHYADVLKWLPAMRPYPIFTKNEEAVQLWADVIYAVTHVVYTLNDYGAYEVSPRSLRPEFAFLKANIELACARHEPELLGELLDSLKAFGLRDSHPLVVRGTSFLLASQNEDGSWGDPDEANIRTRCHTTWTAIDGLRSYARRERLGLPALKPLLKRGLAPIS
jgi:hypothetical protein